MTTTKNGFTSHVPISMSFKATKKPKTHIKTATLIQKTEIKVNLYNPSS